MSKQALLQVMTVGQTLAIGLIAAAAIVSTSATVLAFAGLLPWLDVNATFGGAEVVWMGQALQIGVSALLVLIAGTLPAARRVMRLEATHRRFAVDMDDVTRAYRAAHMADRAEMFEMRREFDAVRERYRYLTDHPELSDIDAELLTIAAQMSEQSRELAAEFSDDKVARARESLKQRLKDSEVLKDRIQSAFASVREIRRMMDEVDVEESTVASQLQRLRDELADFDGFGPDPEPGKGKGKVAHLKSV
ncbi:MAG: DNA repair protein [Boseongicola sp.]|nr:DNA repair protein [Silicimonas sp.]NNF91614.1 DNA repair protein [Boseongicola sp.]